eukprot:TRINITY_DN1403_c0_g1_i1.p1 TRINITY_DN1403_c0_g1~~TRINITY_DN1403_c0_g1_i1.p1  ORF type:complete len:244 (+),score=50.57 TRINITY_DN1403_c0_g1_i1:1267-1998(+)
MWVREHAYRDSICAEDAVHALMRASIRGHAETVAWLLGCFPITAADVRRDRNQLFLSTCANGRLGCAKLLVDAFQLSAEDARAQGNYALRLACENGHLTTVKWLVATFGLQASDVQQCSALHDSCREGCLEVAQWLVGRFSPQLQPQHYSLCAAVRASQLDVADWLVDVCGIPLTALRSFDAQAVVQQGDLSAMLWLIERGVLTAETAASYADAAKQRSKWMQYHWLQRLTWTVQHVQSCWQE